MFLKIAQKHGWKVEEMASFHSVVDNKNALLKSIKSHYGSDKLSDVTLRVESGDDKREFLAHKFILCISSDVLTVMMTSEAWTDSAKKVVTLTESQECFQRFPEFLEFFYTGQTELHPHNVLGMLVLSDKYNVKTLGDLCETYMLENLACMLTSGCTMDWLKFVFSFSDQHLLLFLHCRNFVILNFDSILKAIMSTEAPSDIDEAILRNFLEQPELCVSGEFSLFQMVIWWLGNKSGDVVDRILSLIRFRMMSLPQLFKIIDDTGTMQIPHKDYIMVAVMDAVKYHCLGVDKCGVSVTKNNQHLFSARNYINSVWDMTITLRIVSCLPTFTVCPFYFSTQKGAWQPESNQSWEWMVDVYPKGVKFEKSRLIMWGETLDVPGAEINTVRLSVTARGHIGVRSVDISLLVGGTHVSEENQSDSIAYVKKLIRRRCHFTENSRISVFDDVIPPKDLSCPRAALTSPFVDPEGSIRIHICIKPVPERTGVISHVRTQSSSSRLYDSA